MHASQLQRHNLACQNCLLELSQELEIPTDERGELERLEKLVNKYERGLIQQVDWLDRLAFKSMEKIKDLESSKNGSSHLHVDCNWNDGAIIEQYYVSWTSESASAFSLKIGEDRDHDEGS
ncbi:hypothetical protein L1987_59126 [Smallanthus sonchifolius]|uniref:Uncharacterized protein n=1 Tax=Smallanthus sonchifolius TaxID=185202 RepID=A0ACB9D4G4_9ASTR|nr:hypothetical protein L1987_59126 [Smallanthus sonchifolius]